MPRWKTAMMRMTDPLTAVELPEGGALCAVSGGLDSMPHVSGFVNNLQVCRLNHRQSYPSYAMVCLVIPIVTTCACAVLLQLGILPAV